MSGEFSPPGKNIVIDQSSEYETIGPLRRFFDLILINPILNNLHRIGGGRILKATSRKAGKVREFATTFKALEVLYSFDHRIHLDQGVFDGLFTFLWQHVMNAKAVRNRLRLVKKTIRESVQQIRKNNNLNITIVSIGAGSARAVIEVVSEFVKTGDSNFRIIAIDKNSEAGLYATQLAQQFSLENFFKSFTASLSEEGKYIDIPPDIVEMVGVLDYFDDDQVVKVLDRIRGYLKSGGILITCNINDNPERPFVTHTGGWSMIYRTPEQLKRLCLKAGFTFDKSKFILEPLRIHTLAILKKG